MTRTTGWPHMLPCPFCGGDARHDAHADDCYFILHHKFKNSGADMSPAFEVLAAWNRRSPQPTQAQAGAVESEEFGQFLSDVLTAAGLVTHGKQCKALGERLADMCAKLRHHGIKGGPYDL